LLFASQESLVEPGQWRSLTEIIDRAEQHKERRVVL
jgi:hypothetical protein